MQHVKSVSRYMQHGLKTLAFTETAKGIRVISFRKANKRELLSTSWFLAHAIHHETGRAIVAIEEKLLQGGFAATMRTRSTKIWYILVHKQENAYESKYIRSPRGALRQLH